MQGARETAGTTTKLIVAYVRANFGESGVSRMLEIAGEQRSLEELEDERGWSTYRQKIALFEAAAEITGDPWVARRIGESVLHHQVGSALTFLLSTIGSPRGLLRRVARACPKFSTVATMDAVRVGPTGGTVTYRLHEGHTPSRHDCAYTQGLLSQTSTLFGLPTARVHHEVCQVEGAEACRYEVRWSGAPAGWRRLIGLGDTTEIAKEGLESQLRDLRETVTSLVSADQIDAVLDRIVEGASTAVRAQHYVLAVAQEGERSQVHAVGLPAGEARRVGDDLLAGRPAADGATIVVDITSRIRWYGRLAVSLPPGSDFLDVERDLLEAYGAIAAAALDSATALTAVRQREATARALLDLSSDLVATENRDAVVRALATATPGAVGSDRAAVLLRSETGDAFVVTATAGFDDGSASQLEGLSVSTSDTPELADLLADPGPRMYRSGGADPFIAATMAAFEVRAIAVAPIIVDDRVVGSIVAGWSDGSALPTPGSTLFSRLSGVSNQASTAFGRMSLAAAVRRHRTHDPLTGLANRGFLEEVLAHELDDHRRWGRPSLVIHIDIDRFQTVNESLGHAAGDHLLAVVAARLREHAGSATTIARIGGDEFLLLIPRASRADDEVARAAAVFAEPYHLDGREVLITASIGVASTDVGGSTNEVLAAARAAAARAKAAGGNAWRAADEIDGQAGPDRLALEADLRRAIPAGELHLEYQPQVDVRSGAVVGVEALVRWDHPAHGRLMPGAFLPLAEETGLIVSLDHAMLRAACTQGAAWIAEGVPPLRIAVNVSGRTFCDGDLPGELRRVLDETGFPSDRLEIELTEEGLPDLERAGRTTEEIARMGCSIALDDLGRGHSSLTWIHQLPVHRLKIDRSFVADLGRRDVGAGIVAGLIAMGHELGMTVLAEGVETPEQLRFLEERGGDEAQGYAFARPLSAEACAAYATTHTSGGVPQALRLAATSN